MAAGHIQSLLLISISTLLKSCQLPHTRRQPSHFTPNFCPGLWKHSLAPCWGGEGGRKRAYLIHIHWQRIENLDIMSKHRFCKCLQRRCELWWMFVALCDALDLQTWKCDVSPTISSKKSPARSPLPWFIPPLKITRLAHMLWNIELRRSCERCGFESGWRYF